LPQIVAGVFIGKKEIALAYIMSFFKFMADWGIWDVIQTALAIGGGFAILFYLFPRRSIENFYIDATRGAGDPPYAKVIRIEMRNLTNEPLYVLSRGFRFGESIRASPLAAIDHYTQTCEVKFPGPQPGDLTEIDTLVRHGQPVSTWVPVDPNHADDIIDEALQNRRVGTLRLTCRRQSGRASAVLLNIPV
jgi:hypothetical protein